MATKEERLERLREFEKKIASKKGVGAVYGLVKGLSVTMRTMLKPSITTQYPHEKPDLPPRSRGVIALKEENCTVCMLCSRECPDWCIYIDSHKDVMPPKTPGARPRARNVLDRFAIDYALCMYCGICVEVCPFDALFWSPHFEYSTPDIEELTHEMDTLVKWMDFVPPPPPLEAGSEDPVELSKEPVTYGVPTAAAPAPTTAAPEAPARAEPPPSREGATPDSATEAGGVTGPAETDSPPTQREPEPAARHEEEPPQIDQAAYDAAIAQGKADREARAIAKKAWVLKRRRGEG
jgi:NADH-quinone oxidoreductase subunit I